MIRTKHAVGETARAPGDERRRIREAELGGDRGTRVERGQLPGPAPAVSRHGTEAAAGGAGPVVGAPTAGTAKVHVTAHRRPGASESRMRILTVPAPFNDGTATTETVTVWWSAAKRPAQSSPSAVGALPYSERALPAVKERQEFMKTPGSQCGSARAALGGRAGYGRRPGLGRSPMRAAVA